MTGTFNTPHGKVRCQSHRRFIVVNPSFTGPKPYIAKRSDNLVTAKAYASRNNRGVVVDTVTGEVVV